MFVAPVPCLPAQISEGLSKTIVEQACNLIDVEKHNAELGEVDPADKCSFSVVAPETLRTLLADPPAATHRLNPSSSGTGRGGSLGLSKLEEQLGTQTLRSRDPGSFKEAQSANEAQPARYSLRQRATPFSKWEASRVAKMKLVEQLTLVTLQTAHHRSTSPRFASPQRNHASRRVSTDFCNKICQKQTLAGGSDTSIT